MSLSGSFNTSSYNNMYIEFSWWGSQSISGNYTDVNWTATCRRSSGTGGYYAHWSIVIAGETVNSRSQSNRILITNGNVIASGTKRIYHNNDGTQSFSASISASIYTYATNCTGSGSWTLNTIPRYANPVPTLTARTETSLTVGWTADGTVDQFQYSIDNGATWSAATDPEATTGSFTVSGLTADTAYSVKLKARRKDSQLTNESTTVSMSTYSYPYASTTPDFIIGNSVTLGLFNPLGRTVTVTMDGATGSTSTTTLTLTPTAATLYALIPNATSGTYSVSVTYSGNTLTRTGGLYKVDENANKPAIGAFTYADSNGTATATTLDNQKIVQNISTPKFTGSGLVAQNSATLASCSVEVNGVTYTNSSPSGTTNVQGGVINSTSDVIATLTVTDSRGITNTKTVNVSMIPWTQPSAIITVERQSNFYTETDMTVDASYTQIGSSTITITVLGQAVPITGQVTPSDVTAMLTDNVQSTLNFDNNFAWNITVTLVDSFGGTTTYNTYISRGIPEVFFDRHRNSVGFNQFPQHDNTLEIDGDIYADNINASGNADFGGNASIDGTTTVNGNIYNYGINASDWILETKNKIFLWRENVNETYAGIQKTCDFENESLVLNGTATGDCWYGYTCFFNTNHGIDATPYRGQEMTLSIHPSGLGVRAFLAVYTDTSGNYYDIANSVTDEYTFTVPNDAVIFRIGVYIPNGTTINNVAFQLMLQASSITNQTYTDFAPTNRDMMGSLFVKKFTTSFNIAGGGNAAFTNSFITTPKGYTMVGVVGLSTNSVNVVPVSFRPMFGSSWDFELRNVSSSSSSTNLDVWVLFARGGLAILEQ